MTYARLFQLTPPMWAATQSHFPVTDLKKHFNSHHPCGRRLRRFHARNAAAADFNSHHPCGRRRQAKKRCGIGEVFQLTPPIRVATYKRYTTPPKKPISTHATHKGGDCTYRIHGRYSKHFNSRHP